MAGDVGVAERVISGLRAEGAPSSEPVLHEYGPRFRIGMGTTPSAEGLDGPTVETTAFDVSEMLVDHVLDADVRRALLARFGADPL